MDIYGDNMKNLEKYKIKNKETLNEKVYKIIKKTVIIKLFKKIM